MANVNLGFIEVRRVFAGQYLGCFEKNKLKIQELEGYLRTPNFYRNTNGRAIFIATLWIAMMGAIYYCSFHIVPKSVEKSIRSIGSINATFAAGRTLAISYLLGIIGIFGSAIACFLAFYLLARSPSIDRSIVGELNRKNSDLQKKVQGYIKECQENIRKCDIVLNMDLSPDGSGGRRLYGECTPWEALKEIIDGSSRGTLNEIQGREAMGHFLQQKADSITQFRQANEAAKGQLEALRLLLA